MLFKYTGFDKNGQKTKGKIEADNIESVKAQLKQKKDFIQRDKRG
jgi:type II secretory pathway component PulF